MTEEGLDKTPLLRGAVALNGQERLGVRADDADGGAELVRDIGDEVPSNRLETSNLRDVMHDDDPAAIGLRGRASVDGSSRSVGRGTERILPGRGHCELYLGRFVDARAPKLSNLLDGGELIEALPVGVVVEIKERSCSTIRERNPTTSVEGDDRLLHALKHNLKPVSLIC